MEINMEMKLCRICWNTAGWRRPTGEAAELETGDSYVAQHGYGHEEWLFNYEWMIDGFRYGFVQPIGKFHARYAGETTSLCLYTITPDRTRLIVGVIHKAYIPTLYETQEIYNEFDRRGWIKQMREDCEVLNVGPFNSDGINEGGVINIRFKPEDVEFFDPMLTVDSEHTISRNYRYHPFNWDGEISSVVDLIESKLNNDSKRSEQSRMRSAQAGVQYDPTHVRLQNRVYDILTSHFGDENVFYERNYVDLSVDMSNKFILIEIKTASTAKRCIREAIGQLLEYAHYYGKDKNYELVVMGDAPLTKESEIYLSLLQNKYNIPLFYSQYIWQEDLLKGWGENINLVC